MSKSIDGSPALTGASVPNTEADLAAFFEASEANVEEPKKQDEDSSEEEDSPVLSQAETSSEVDEAEPETEEAEETEEPEQADEDGAEEDSSEEASGNLSELEYPAFKKRVDRLTAQKNELKDQVEALRNEVNSLRSDQGSPAVEESSGSKFENLSSVDEYNKARDASEQAKRWAMDALDSEEDSFSVTMPNGETEEISRAEVERIYRKADYTLTHVLPKEAEKLNQKTQLDQYADEVYPWLKDKDSTEFKEALEIARQFPELQSNPGFRLAVGDLIEGQKMRKGKAKQSQVKRPKIAPPQPTKSATPAPVNKREANRQKAMAGVMKSGGSRDELTKLFETL